MVEIVGAIGISHVPALAPMVEESSSSDHERFNDFEPFRSARAWLAEKNPDALIVVYNDHGAAFSLDLVPTFAIGAAARYERADEGLGRELGPAFAGDPELSWHIIDGVVPEGFDLTVCQRMEVDHGLSVPFSVLVDERLDGVRVVPLAVNVVQQPTPSAERCFELGRAIGRALASYPDEARIAIIGTGGMSHQLQGPRAGHINSEFDRMFLERIVHDPERLTGFNNAEYIDLAGSEGAELVMWLVMRGAIGDRVDEVMSGYTVPVSNTAAGVIVLEPTSGALLEAVGGA